MYGSHVIYMEGTDSYRPVVFAVVIVWSLVNRRIYQYFHLQDCCVLLLLFHYVIMITLHVRVPIC